MMHFTGDSWPPEEAIRDLADQVNRLVMAMRQTRGVELTPNSVGVRWIEENFERVTAGLSQSSHERFVHWIGSFLGESVIRAQTIWMFPHAKAAKRVGGPADSLITFFDAAATIPD